MQVFFEDESTMSPLKFLYSPKGKINRIEFLFGSLLCFIILIVLTFIALVQGFTVYQPTLADDIYEGVLLLIFSVTLFYSLPICLCGKRLRDIGFSPKLSFFFLYYLIYLPINYFQININQYMGFVLTLISSLLVISYLLLFILPSSR